MQAPRRILSIQSHVAFGYVGGKAAVFPLQCMGYDVDVINTVNYSNHAGYGRAGGTKTSPQDLHAIYDGMRQNELDIPGRLLTGYVPTADALQAVAEIATELKGDNPNLIYLMDPVLGDAGHMYVAPEALPVYKTMLPLATIITPNYYEVELLSGFPLTSLSNLHQALKILHEEFHVPNVVISSIPLQPWLKIPSVTSILPKSENGVERHYLICLASAVGENIQSQPSIVHARPVYQIPGYYSGVGDLFSALVLGNYQPGRKCVDGETPLSHAASVALAKTHGVLQRTYDYSESLPQDEKQQTDDEQDTVNPLQKSRRMRGRELRLVQNQDLLRSDAPIDEMVHLDEFWAS